MSIPARNIDPDDALFRKKIFLAMVVPGFLVSLMWIVKITEELLGISFSDFGIYPLTERGLKGILFSPFIHADFSHLFNNTLPLFLLGTALFYFYSDIAFRVLGWTYVLTGLLVWFAGREAWHIGASGLVYGLASFLFFSGIIRQHFRLIALSLLIVFLYGSIVWGLFPGVYKNLSWESHMLGFVSGIILAIWFRKMGPQRPEYQWMDEEDDGEVDENENGSTDTDSGDFTKREHESTRSN
jgi:membrane associated rhomboid family serine protease